MSKQETDKYQNILIATDLGINTVALIERAKRLASASTSIRLLHVVRPFETTFFGTMPYIPVMPLGDKDAFEERVFTAKQELFAEIAKDHSLDESLCIIETGDPKERIPEFAQANACDLIITASQHKKEKRPYFGSTAKAIVQNTPCDVLVVKIDH
ncbi:MAG: universal stress protein [Gammaproteobacteria bacterium]|nr:universal stress protein [Gammaproteobacteria bacterium]NNC96698.1 universal stress protein [Gammaproteobacteria bacterium]NNM13798.1 universal stress protein [Gammaproteobacteria bacterium]